MLMSARLHAYKITAADVESLRTLSLSNAGIFDMALGAGMRRFYSQAPAQAG